MAEFTIPHLHLSTYTNERLGKVYQVFRRSMPAMAENTDLQVALEVYCLHREDFKQFHDGSWSNPLPEEPSVWDGDAGKWITLKEVQDHGS